MTIVKQNAATKTGLTLGGTKGLPAVILGVSLDGAAAKACPTPTVGERLLAVNGTPVVDHDAASQLLRAATGEVVLLIAPADAGSARVVRDATQPRPSSPAALAMQGLVLARTRTPPSGEGCDVQKAAAATSPPASGADCRYGAKCARSQCKFKHPAAAETRREIASLAVAIAPACRFGAKCARPQCTYP